MLQFFEWTGTWSNHVYGTTSLPLWLSCFFMLVCLGVFAAGKNDSKERVAKIGVMMFASGGLLLTFTLFAILFVSLIHALFKWQYTAIVFRDLILLGCVPAAISTLLLLPAWKKTSSSTPTTIILGLSWLFAQLAMIQGIGLLATKKLPHIEDGLGTHVHAHLTFPIEIKALYSHGWEAVDSRQTIKTGKPGDTLVLRHVARHWSLLHIWRKRSIHVVREVGPAGFPLQVGNRWVYAKKLQVTNSLIAPPYKRNRNLMFEIKEMRVRHGLRQFALEASTDKHSRTVWLYGADGELFLNKEKHRKYTYHGSTKLEVPNPGQRVSPYDFTLLPGQCHGVTTAKGTFELPGVCRCAGKSKTSPLAPLFGVITLGIATPGHNMKKQIVLISSHKGPKDAPFTPTLPLQDVPQGAEDPCQAPY